MLPIFLQDDFLRFDEVDHNLDINLDRILGTQDDIYKVAFYCDYFNFFIHTSKFIHLFIYSLLKKFPIRS